MNIDDLMKGDSPKALSFPHFPSRYQAVIWRNWGLVPHERLALILETSKGNVERAANDLGLPNIEVSKNWLEKGYLTIIRNNWHLLAYGQLLALLDWTPDKMDYILREEDFLWHKLGNHKPSVVKTVFSQLTEDEKKRTELIKQTASGLFNSFSETERPFDFIREYSSYGEKDKSKSCFDLNFIYSFHALYGDTLMESELDPYPDTLLKAYSETGVNGIWIQVILYTLYPFENAPEYSRGWEKRIEGLRELVKRAKKFGIKVYLYLNEPRGMPERFFEKYPEWKGVEHKDIFALCTSVEGVRKYLEDSCFNVFKNVPGLGGIFCITMSENLTNCHAKRFGDKCPLCSQKSVAEVIAETVSAIEKGVHRAAPEARVMTHTWAWSEDTQKTIDLLPEQVEVLGVSEWGKEFEFQGVRGSVVDYSMSVIGPSEEALKAWSAAKSRGLKTVAKVQLNNSWECSAVPYLPVPYLVKEHLDNLEKAGVSGLMSSWTLGGYPGPNLELTFRTPEEVALERYGVKASDAICEAWKTFGDAFREFPFHVGVLYVAPQNYGPMSLFYEKSTGYKATMIGFPYDDLEGWRAIYPEDVFESQFAKLCEKWEKGLDELKKAREFVSSENLSNFIDLENVSEAAFCHFKSTLNQIRFVRKRNSGRVDGIQELIDDEINITERLLAVVSRDSRVGFEASNHYYYTRNDLIEKILNCLDMKRKFIK
ncbi:MAG: hypothetical protein A2020_10195 [Lentisphaerae bacterium GWF2_45_14]|nr:MAG: hypothetical protein A2020_10195 [Lentisphaerae bacterium GWF2_45_14]